MKILSFGSANIDFTCQVASIVRPGQTIDSLSYGKFPGGKGLNQSIATARAGAEVYHAGMIGADGGFLKELLEQSGVDCTYLKTTQGYTGSTFIQVDAQGQNSIVLIGGANRENTRENCDEILSHFSAGDILLLQNEINCVDYLIEQGYARGMKVVLNPSPLNETVLGFDLSKVSMFLMNEDEGQRITGQTSPEVILDAMDQLYPHAEVVLTLGAGGSIYHYAETTVRQKAYRVKTVDTTGAGDTFTGYFLAAIARGADIARALQESAAASAIAVSRPGAAVSIPTYAEVEKALEEFTHETC